MDMEHLKRDGTGGLMSKTVNKKLEYKIDASLADDLYLVKNDLKEASAGYWSHKHIAGLCLLGEKDGLVDKFVPMLSSKGCWDAPEINHAQFYKAFEKMIRKDRRVIGMAIIKPDDLDERIVRDIKRNIWGWRKTFEDISQTIWLVVSDDNIIPYRPYIDSTKRLVIRKSSAQIWVNKDVSATMKVAEGKEIVKKIYDYGDRKKITILMERVVKGIRNGGSENILKKHVSNLDKELMRHKEAIEKKKEKEKNDRKIAKETASARIEAGEIIREKRKEYITSIGNGMILVKTSDGKEILWQET